jgi:hypothetical protein
MSQIVKKYIQVVLIYQAAFTIYKNETVGDVVVNRTIISVANDPSIKYGV